MRKIFAFLLLILLPTAAFAAVAVDGTPYAVRDAATVNTSNAVIPSDAHAGDGAILGCSTTHAATWTTPSGWSIVPNSTQNSSQPFTIFFEKILVGGDLGANVACTFTGTAGNIGKVIVTASGTPPSGEITDVNHTQHNAAGTTLACQDAGVTPKYNGDLLVFFCQVPASSVTFSSWTNTGTLSLTQQVSANGEGAASVLLANKNATATNEATISGSQNSEGTTITFADATKVACDGNDACVQQTTVAQGVAADPAPTLGTSTTAGNALIALIALATGNATAAPSGNAGSWTKVADSGSVAGGKRFQIWCGIVSTPGTTITWNVSGGNSNAQLVEFSGYTCNVDPVGAKTTNGTGTSASPASMTTQFATDLVLAGVTHLTAETVTDGNDANGYLKLNTSGLVPTFNSDYQITTITAAFGPTWSWPTSGAFGAVSVALESGVTLLKAIAHEDDYWAAAIPASNPTPSPPNVGPFAFTGFAQPSGALPAHAKGWTWVIPWAALEPQDGVYNWAPITNVEAGLSAGQYMQLLIMTGQSSPTSTSACTAASSFYPGVSGCTAWLVTDGVTGVNTHWDYINTFIPTCAATFEPNPHDTIYQSKLATFLTAFETQFTGDSHIAMVSIQPISHWGFDSSIGAKNQKCPNTTSPESYATAWGTLCHNDGVCSSITDETGWQTYVEGSFNTIWDNMKTTLHDQNLMIWVEPALVLNINTGAQDNNITLAWNAHAAANKPADGKYNCGNEAMPDNNNWVTTVNTYCQGADNWGGQGKANIANVCASMLDAFTTFGCNAGAAWVQPYAETGLNSFTNCPTEIAAVSAACGGP